MSEDAFERDVAGYVAAFAEWDEKPWDHLASEGLMSDETIRTTTS